MIIIMPRHRLRAVMEENRKKRKKKAEKEGKKRGVRKPRKEPQCIEEEYSNAVVIDVTSKSGDEYRRMSPFYPHRDIPVPYSPNWVSASVEAIWQGLKVFEKADIDTSLFQITDIRKMHKRTSNALNGYKYGRILGHRRGVNGRKDELLDAVSARIHLYAPAYRWVLENKVPDLVEKIRTLSSEGTVVLVDYETNCDIHVNKPISHAGLIKAYIEGTYPDEPLIEDKPLSPELLERIPVGRRVIHAQFGVGRVTEVQGDRVRVLFRTSEKVFNIRSGVIEPYDGLEPVVAESNGESVALLQNEQWLWGVQADPERKMAAVPCEYEQIVFYAGKLVQKQKVPTYYFLVRKSGLWGLMNKIGRLQAPCRYNTLVPKETDGLLEGFSFRRGGVKGLIDGKGTETRLNKMPDKTTYIQRYNWLIGFLLELDGATFPEISAAWGDADINSSGEPLSRDTFNKHLKAIPKALGVRIFHSKEDHKYRVDNYHGQLDHFLDGNLLLKRYLDQNKNLEGRILFERSPKLGDEQEKRLGDIAQAMSDGRMILLDYMSYRDDRVTRRTLAPYCLKMSRRRWYLVGKDGDALKTFALDDRLRGVKILNETFQIPQDFDAAAFFSDAYGVTLGKEACEVKIKTFGLETKYWRSAPFHPSQKEIETGDDYAIFSFFLYPDAPEFIHALLSHGATIEVLEPASLRETLKAKINEMTIRYQDNYEEDRLSKK